MMRETCHRLAANPVERSKHHATGPNPRPHRTVIQRMTAVDFGGITVKSFTKDFAKRALQRIIPRTIAARFLAVTGLFAILFFAFVLYCSWSQSNVAITGLLEKQTELVLCFDLAVRQYVAESVRPFAQQYLDPNQFIPELMSTSFVARSIFEKVRPSFPDYILKFSSPNPRNPANQAGPEELHIIEYFNNNPEATCWLGPVTLQGKPYFARFYPRRATPSCLRCHGDPKDAPQSLIQRYGGSGGFHHKPGNIIALDSVAIPVERYKAAAFRTAIAHSFMCIVAVGLLLVALYWAFHRLVVRKLALISAHFYRALDTQAGSPVALIDYEKRDELAPLVQAFNTLALKLRTLYQSLQTCVEERTAQLEATNRRLQTEINRRAKTEQALRESETKYRTLVERSSDGICILHKGRLAFTNDSLARMVGTTPNRMLDHALDEFLYPGEHRRVNRKHRRFLSRKVGEYRCETALRHRDGTRIDVEFNIAPISYRGELAALIFVRDITARKHAERLQAERLARLQRQRHAIVKLATHPAVVEGNFSLAAWTITELAAQALDVGHASIWMFNDDHKYLRCVERFERVANRHSAGTTLLISARPNYFKALQTGRSIDVHDACNDPRTREFADDYFRPMGIGSTLDAPIRLDGKVVGVICLEHLGCSRHWHQDEVTFAAEVADQIAHTLLNSRRRQAEIALRRAKCQTEQANRRLELALEQANVLAREAIAANKAKTQFLANMSHEIRTPLNAILGFTQILADENLTDEQRHYLQIITDSARSLLRLIDDVLDLSKIEADKLDIEPQPCLLPKLLDSVEQMLRPQAEQKRLAFRISLAPDVPQTIYTDPDRLRQCLLNLLNNAIKFTPEGFVHLDVSVQSQQAASILRFDVIDTGVGIPPDRQQAVFDAFTQADGSTTRKFGGTGLGLTITRKLVERLGGTITLKSEPGKGSVFSITLPLQHDPPPSATPETPAHSPEQLSPQPPTPRPGAHILVVEDTPTNQTLIRLLLESMNLRVTIAADGHQAVEKALSQSFDLILMDIQMPNMNGYEATGTLRARKIATPIIALTANAMQGDRQKALAAGCNDYLAKPIDRHQLQVVLAKYLCSTHHGLATSTDTAATAYRVP